MTNKQDEGETSIDRSPRLAALLAVHLVSQVLDEAYVIANAAQESGQPWRYLTMHQMLKNCKNSGIGFADDEDKSASKGDNVKENNIEMVANIVATSTPQKIAARQIECLDDTLTGFGESFNDSTLIGQGDEVIEKQQDDDLTNSTSMFINHLFDMSDVERVIFCDDTEDIPSTPEPNDQLDEAMSKIMDVANAFKRNESMDLPTVDSFIASVFPLLEDLSVDIEQNVNDNVEGPVEMLSRSDNSEYSFLADAFVPDIGRDVTFYIADEGSTDKVEIYGNLQKAMVEEITESQSADLLNEDIEKKVNSEAEVIEKEAIKQKNDFQLYENAYSTLNRDYDQGSEDDGYPILQDPKEMILQEVELLTATTSDEELRYPKASVSKPREDEATVSGISGSRKSTFSRKCRLQGARLLACLRGWWRRKTPGKHKDSRRSGLAVCPLSPEARRRTCSLLDNRLLRTASSSGCEMWKFNTVNEAVVNSNRWKDYTFDAEGSGDL